MHNPTTIADVARIGAYRYISKAGYRAELSDISIRVYKGVKTIITIMIYKNNDYATVLSYTTHDTDTDEYPIIWKLPMADPKFFDKLVEFTTEAYNLYNA